MKMNKFLKAARAYRKKGFSVFALLPKSKKPKGSWKKYQQEPPSDELIEKWAKASPEPNLAIVTGLVSGGLVAVDVDPRNGGDKSIQGKHLPPTPCVKTGGGGFHYYFRTDEPIHCGTIAPGIDIKATGGYIAAPPSRYPSGKSYEWAENLGLDDVDIQPLPDWVLALINGGKAPTKDAWTAFMETDDDRHKDTIKLVEPHWTGGNRNNLSLCLSGFLAKAGWPWESTRQVIESLCKGDEESKSRIETLKSTYKRLQEGQAVKGYAGLLKLLPREVVNQLNMTVRSCTDSIQAKIFDIRATKNLPAVEKHRMIAVLVRRHISSRAGDLLLVPGPRHFFFEKRTKMAFPIQSLDMTSLLDTELTLNSQEMETRCVVEHLVSYTHRHGRPTDIYHLCHYDKARHALYVNMGKGRIAKLDGERIEVKDNGTDGVLLMDDMEPIEPDLSADLDLRRLMFQGVNFTRHIDRTLQEALCWAWFRSTFFFSLQATRPILALLGPKGSGKTFLMKIFLRLWYGLKRTEPDSITKEDAFEASIANNYLLTLDNVDERLDWLNDSLAKAATGQIIRKRELYTTNDEVSFQPRCFVALSSRTPHFKREDVSDRLLIVRLDRLPEGEFCREEILLAPFTGANRNKAWGCLLKELNACVAWIKRQGLPNKTPHRLADWEALAITLAAKDDSGPVLAEAMRMLESERLSFILEDDSFIQSISKFADGQWRSSKELWDTLGGKDSTFKSPRSLAAYLANTVESLRKACGMEVRRDGHSKTNLYRFPQQNGEPQPPEPIDQEDPPQEALDDYERQIELCEAPKAEVAGNAGS